MIRPRDVETLLQGMRDDPACQWQRYATRFLPKKRPSQARKSGCEYPPGCALFQPFADSHPRNAEKARYLKHVGIYAYRAMCCKTTVNCQRRH